MADFPTELHAEIEKLERKHAEQPEGRYFVPLANAYRKLGDVERAETLLREGLRYHPEYLSAHIVLGRCLADRGANDQASEEFRHVLSADPQNLIALRTLGEIALSEGRRNEAERWYSDLLTVDPMNEDARRVVEDLRQQAVGSAPPETDEPWVLDERSAPDEPIAAGEPTGLDDLPSADMPLDAGSEPAWSPEQPYDFAGEQPQDQAEVRDLDAYGMIEGLGEPQPSTPGEFTPEDTEDLFFDASAAPGAGGEAEVFTETMAELYAQQGFYDRAAEVYRELIRERGPEPELARHLQEVERLAREGGGTPEQVAGPDEEALPWLQTFDQAPTSSWEAGTEDPTGGDQVPDLDLAADRSAADDSADPFVDSFSTGFGADEPMWEAEPSPEEMTVPAEPEPREVGASQWGETDQAEPLRAGPSISDFFAELLAWQPGAATTPEPSPAAREQAAAETEATAYETPGAPFPWELPEAAGAEPEAEGAELEGLTSLDSLLSQTAPVETEMERPPLQQAPATGETAAPAEEDEDLESFQAWLRSLKR